MLSRNLSENSLLKLNEWVTKNEKKNSRFWKEHKEKIKREISQIQGGYSNIVADIQFHENVEKKYNKVKN